MPSDSSRFENRPPPWGKDVDAEPVSFGTWLRRQREMRGVDLRDIAERTKISLRYLEAMEDDRFDILPAPIFAKGFLREYAKHVGLSPDEVVNHFLAVHQPPAGDAEPVVARERSGRGRSLVQMLLLALAALLLLGLVAVLAYWAERRRERTDAEQPPPIAAPATARATTAPPPPPPDRPRAPIELTLDFVEECWVELTIDGTRRIAELRVQGESLQIQAQQAIQLELGNAKGVQAQLNGQPLRLWGPTDTRVKDLVIDLEMARRVAGGAAAPAPAERPPQ
ncbi:MAG TPA: helix-turn-helix domain-containing protein [Thermoanaerobaculia bacterium]|nr:helix-turn-helix domain-containing protein [Thermoanaerobaculia bacterium]